MTADTQSTIERRIVAGAAILFPLSVFALFGWALYTMPVFRRGTAAIVGVFVALFGIGVACYLIGWVVLRVIEGDTQ